MKKFTDFFRNNDQNQDFLSKLTDPLKKSFGIDVFWSSTLLENGQFSCLCSYNDAFGHFWENQCYKDMGFYVCPSRLKSGYFLLDHDADYKKYMDNTQVKYPLFHPFLIIRKEGKNKANLFGFASKQHTPSLPSLYINNLSILNSYLDYFIEEQNDQNTVINLAQIRGYDAFYKMHYGENCLPSPDRNSSFLKQIGVSKDFSSGALGLSAREKEVLLGCLAGKTATQNGEELGLSARTVQFYIENTKNKLGTMSRKELLENGRLLKMAGFLDL